VRVRMEEREKDRERERERPLALTQACSSSRAFVAAQPIAFTLEKKKTGKVIEHVSWKLELCAQTLVVGRK